MSIDELCTHTGVDKYQPFHKRHHKDVLKKYRDDLERVVALAAEGYPEPGGTALKRHFRSTLGVTVSRNTLNRHLQLLREGEPLWAEK